MDIPLVEKEFSKDGKTVKLRLNLPDRKGEWRTFTKLELSEHIDLLRRTNKKDLEDRASNLEQEILARWPNPSSRCEKGEIEYNKRTA